MIAASCDFLLAINRDDCSFLRPASDKSRWFRHFFCELHYNQKWIFLWKWIATFLQILPRISAHFIHKILHSRNRTIIELNTHKCFSKCKVYFLRNDKNIKKSTKIWSKFNYIWETIQVKIWISHWIWNMIKSSCEQKKK